MAPTFRTRWNLHVLLIIGTIVIVSYTLVRMGVIELPAPKTDSVCPVSAILSKIPEENRQKIVNYPLVDSIPYLTHLGLQDVDGTENFDGNPVLVTASSANHFSQVSTFVKNIKTTLIPTLKIFVYDIGLTKEQRQTLCSDGECMIREFPFEEYPEFLKESLPSIAWKPVIIQMLLKEYGFVVWMDSVVYIPDGNIQGGIEIARREGIAIGHRRLVNKDINLAFETDERTFRALGEEPCAFEKQYKFNAALIFIKRSEFTYKYIMRPWVSCALKKTCISADYRYYSRCEHADRYGYCHRYDQSVLSIILNRLFYRNYDAIDIGHAVQWTKCYVRDEVAVFNEMVFVDTKDNYITCPAIEFRSVKK